MVSDTYYPYPGGIPEHIHHLAKELRRRGHLTKILTAWYGESSRSTFDAEEDDHEFVMRVGRGIIIPSNRSYARVTVDLHMGHKIKKFFQEERFDIVHVHGSLAPTLPLSAIKESRAITVGTFHSEHESSAGYRWFRWFLMPYFRRIAGLIAVSNAARDSMTKYFPGDYRLIPNGVDTEFFRLDAEPMPQYANGRPKILFMGRFEPRKGLTYLLKALPIIKEAIPDIQCLVVGAGPFGYAYYSKFLDKSVADDVVFAGLIPSRERPRYYASCDVFCAPSTGNESFGIVLLEAMAAGRPVVASDIAGYREVLADGVEGLSAPPMDEKAIADRIIRILRDKSLARRMGEAGRAKALTYSWPRVTDQVEAFYRELMAAPATREIPNPKRIVVSRPEAGENPQIAQMGTDARTRPKKLLINADAENSPQRHGGHREDIFSLSLCLGGSIFADEFRSCPHRVMSRRTLAAGTSQRPNQGPNLLSLLPDPTPTPTYTLSVERPDEVRSPCHRPVSGSDYRRPEGKPGGLLRAKRHLS